MNMKSVLTYNCDILDDRKKKGLTEVKPSALKFCYAVIKEIEIEIYSLLSPCKMPSLTSLIVGAQLDLLLASKDLMNS